eukprot:g2094.t1
MATAADHAIAGTVGGMAASVLFYPLDTIRVVMQVAKKGEGDVGLLSVVGRYLKSKEDFEQLYLGLYPTLVSVGVSQAIYFFLYHSLKNIVERATKRPVGTQVNLVIAYLAGMANATATSPLWVLATRMKLEGKNRKKDDDDKNKQEQEQEARGQGRNQDNALNGQTPGEILQETRGSAPVVSSSSGSSSSSSSSSISTSSPPSSVAASSAPSPLGFYGQLRKLVAEEGLAGCFKGLRSSLILCINPSIQFAVYERLRQIMLKRQQFLTPFQSFVMGALAKAVATLLTYPLQVIQARVRVRGANVDDQAGVVGVLRGIIRQEGWGGLVAGLVPKLMQTCSTSAFIFLFYEQFLRSTVLLRMAIRRRALRQAGGQ